MGENNIYIKWKEYRKEIRLNENFSSRVMTKIHECEMDRTNGLSEFFSIILNLVLTWLLRFALAFGLLALNYQWAY